MQEKLGNAILGAVFAVAVFATPAAAQKYDFATCNPATVAATACSATVTSCCHENGAIGSSFITSGTDKALIIPMDRCHQTPGTATRGVPNYVDSSFPHYCYKATGGGDDGMFKAYGLVYRLLQTQNLGADNAIDVYWLINPSKDPPALTAAQSVNTQVYLTSDIDVWVVSSGGTAPTAAVTCTTGSCLSGMNTGETPPVKWVTVSSAGTLTVQPTTTWNYDRKQFPIRGSAFMIAAKDRAKFEKFLKGQAPYDSTAMPFQARANCGNGACNDWSEIEMFEIQSSSWLTWANFTAGVWQNFQIPVATTLNYKPPRIARLPQGAVSGGWLAEANLKDVAGTGCKVGAFNPTDAVYCDVAEADVAANSLVSGDFGWFWADGPTLACATFDKVRTFATQVPGVRPAGNVMLIDQPVATVESCSGRPMLGADTTTGLNTAAAGTAAERYILRYPQNMFMQWGDVPTNWSSGSIPGWMRAGAGNGYNPLLLGGTTTLKRLATMDTGTLCANHKATTGNGGDGAALACDETASTTNDRQDLATYGRYQNDGNNGVVFYLPGNQIDQSVNSSQLRMVLNSLLATPLGTVPIEDTEPTTVEVSRNSPIVALLDGVDYVFQGTYEKYDPDPGAPSSFNTDADASTFRFPFQKGHLRGRLGSSISTVATTFDSGTILLDAADDGMIPDASNTYAGCGGGHFTSSCRTIFTTTAGGQNPDVVFFNKDNVGTIGPMMAPNLSSGSQETLMQRVIAGDDDSGTFEPALGGVDRSTVAVIESSPVVNGSRPTIAYFGATDGMLHAVCVTKGSSATGAGECSYVGQELWAYIPRKLLPVLRYNTARIDGSPRVVDVFGDFSGSGKRTWKTVLTFQTGTGAASYQDRVPATYAVDISDPFDPKILWEYGISNTAALATHEPGPGLTVAMGVAKVGTELKNLTWIQTANLGTAGSGTVVVAIDTETGEEVWKRGQTYSAPRTSGNKVVPSSGLPGGVVPVDTYGTGIVTDLLYANLYGEVWKIDPSTKASRYQSGTTDLPLFRFKDDFQPIGGKPALFSTAGGRFAVFASGGFADPSNEHWACNSADITACTTVHKAVAIDIDADSGAFDETHPTNVKFAFNLGAGERAYASVRVIGTEVFVTSDDSNVNSSSFGTSGTATGAVTRYDFAGSSPATTVAIAGGAGSVATHKGTVYTGSSSGTQKLATDATTSGASIDPSSTIQVTRQLWLRVE